MQTARLEQLLALGNALAAVETYDDTSAELARHAKRIVGATNVSIAVVDDDAAIAHVYRGPNVVGGTSSIRVVSLQDDVPSTGPIRSGRPVRIDSFAEFDNRYPQLDQLVGAHEDRVMACFPLHDAEAIIGSMFFRFSESIEIDDEIELLLTQIVDLTERHIVRIKASHELHARALRLQQSNSDLENYAAVVAHDFRSPVRRIRSFTQLLIEEVKPLSSNANDYASAITRQVDYLDRILTDVLQYATALTPAESMEVVDLEAIVDQVEVDLADALAAKSGTFTRGPLPRVRGHETLLKQLISNLVQNAISYSRVGVPLEISIIATQTDIEVNAPWWKISVHDNGIGFDSDTHESAFKMFTRMDPADGVEGTGIGLAFSKRVVELHGGDIGIESQLGMGSELWFTLGGQADAHEFL